MPIECPEIDLTHDLTRRAHERQPWAPRDDCGAYRHVEPPMTALRAPCVPNGDHALRLALVRHLSREDLCRWPSEERKKRLPELLKRSEQTGIACGEHIEGNGAVAFKRASAMALKAL
jgi:hypothetical protein